MTTGDSGAWTTDKQILHSLVEDKAVIIFQSSVNCGRFFWNLIMA